MAHDPAPNTLQQAVLQLLAAAFAQVDDAVIVVDNDYRITYLNAKAAVQYGVDAHAMVGKPLDSLHQHFWLDPGDEEAAFRSLAQHGSWHGENIHRRHDGRQLHVESTVTAIKGDGGEPLGLVAIIRDVTAQKQMAAALDEMQELHELALEGGQLGTWAVDLETNTVQWGARCRQIFGLGPDEPASLEKSFAIIHPEDRPHAEAAFAAAANPASDGRYAVEKRIIRPDGTICWVATRDKVFFTSVNGERRARRLVGVVVDISERKRAEEELGRLMQQLLVFSNTLEQRVAERTAELERSNRELDRFVYVASHDLKSPLQGIEHLAMWAEEDAGGSLSPTAQRHLARLRQRARRLQLMLDDLFHYARAGRRYSLELVRTREVVQSVGELLDVPAGFTVQVDGELPNLVCARRPLEIVLYNLIENAVKHHDRPQRGMVIVSARVQEGFVEFRVCDDGPGIAPQYHGRIFDIFQTLRPRDEVEGSGMGLAIAKKTVESAGGGIWVEPSAGRGATFCFTWPQAAPTGK